MAQVTLRINGYAYTIGCKDGEEKHLEAMGAEVSRRIEGVRAVAGQSGEARMLVMAALLMADELFEVRGRIATLEASVGEPAKPDPKLGRKLSRMAKQAEEIANEMEPGSRQGGEKPRDSARSSDPGERRGDEGVTEA